MHAAAIEKLLETGAFGIKIFSGGIAARFRQEGGDVKQSARPRCGLLCSTNLSPATAGGLLAGLDARTAKEEEEE